MFIRSERASTPLDSACEKEATSIFIYEPNHDQINKRTTMPVEQKESEMHDGTGKTGGDV